jgi:hypothetical protein
MNAVKEFHRVILTNTRMVRLERRYLEKTHEEIGQLILDLRAQDNGVRVISVYHRDGSLCRPLAKVGA